MRYRIFGYVAPEYGVFDLYPTDTPIPPEDFAIKLRDRFFGNPAIGEIKVASLDMPSEDENSHKVDGVSIYVDPTKCTERFFDFKEVHAAVGLITLMYELGEYELEA